MALHGGKPKIRKNMADGITENDRRHDEQKKLYIYIYIYIYILTKQ